MFIYLLVMMLTASQTQMVASDKSQAGGEKRSRISVVLVNQPHVRKITFTDKVHRLPTVTFVFPPYTDQTLVTKKYPDGRTEELFMYELPMDLLTAISALDQDVVTSNLRGIINITPRFRVLYKKCFDVFKRLIKLKFHEKTAAEPSWYHFW